MQRGSWGAVLALAFGVSGLISPAAAQPAAATSVPPIARAALSPSGRLLALEVTVRGRPALSILDNDDLDAPAKLFNLGDQRATRIQWANEDYLLIHTAQIGPGDLGAGGREQAEAITFGGQAGVDYRQLEYTTLYALDVRSMRAKQMLSGTTSVAFTTRLDDVASIAPADGGAIMMRAPVWRDVVRSGSLLSPSSPMIGSQTGGLGVSDRTVGSQTASALWSVNLRTGRGRLVGDPDLAVRDWIVDRAGNPLGRVDRDATITLSTDAGARRVPVAGVSTLKPLAVRPDGRTLEALVATADDGPREPRLIDLETGAVRPFEPALSFTAKAYLFDEATGAIDAVFGDGGAALWVDAERGAVVAALRQAFSAPVMMVSSSRDGARHVVRVEGADGAEYFLYDAARQAADLLGPAAAGGAD